VPARYVAIIMDGTARGAAVRGVPTLAGHQAGVDTLKQTVKDAVKLGIQELTVYAFSTENWSRPEDEVSGLMAIFAERIQSETPELDDEGVRIRYVGRRDGIDPDLVRRMEWSERETEGNERLKLFVAFNYGGRREILDAAERYEGGGDEEFAKHLYAPEMKDPDLLIRTSGERRLSNFLLWQTAYAELVFTDTLWPDFDESELSAALAEYDARQRRFGAR
jgi:undecaprenyl diphosphate synthase